MALQTTRRLGATITTAGTLTAGQHTPVDATAGPLTVTLPTGVTIGAHLSVEKRDSSNNTVTVSGTIRATTATIALGWQYESVTLRYDGTSWIPTEGHKTRASLDATYATPADAAHLTQLAGVAPASGIPAAILDLNYASKMALYGPETYTRTATDTYLDLLGVSRTAATNTPAFDRQNRAGVGWFVPFGLKADGVSGIATMNAAAILPSAGFTLVVDVDRPTALSGAGGIVSLNSGTTANRVTVYLSTNYNAQFIVQTAGSVIVNQQLGATQFWWGGPRRLVFSVAANSFLFADDGQVTGAVTTGALPTPSGLTHLDIGGSGYDTDCFAGWVRRVQILPTALTASQVLNLSAGAAPVACWGDSLTTGTGSTGSGSFYPDQLRLSRYPHSGVYNGGVGGDTSTQIRTRMVADTTRNAWTAVIWAGRNNYDSQATVLADIDAMVTALTHRRFLIMSVINKADGTENSGSTAYNQIVALNAALAAKYPNNYLDIRSLIVAASGGANDAPNPAWSADGLHLTNTGYTYVAGQVSAYLDTKRWF